LAHARASWRQPSHSFRTASRRRADRWARASGEYLMARDSALDRAAFSPRPLASARHPGANQITLSRSLQVPPTTWPRASGALCRQEPRACRWWDREAPRLVFVTGQASGPTDPRGWTGEGQHCGKSGASKQFRRGRSIRNAQIAGWICAAASSQSTVPRQSRIGNSVRRGPKRESPES